MVPLLPLAIGASAIVSLARRAVMALGFGVIAYTGLSVILSRLEAAMLSALNVPGGGQAAVCLLQLDTCVSIILAAFSVRVAMIPAKRLGIM